MTKQFDRKKKMFLANKVIQISKYLAYFGMVCSVSLQHADDQYLKVMFLRNMKKFQQRPDKGPERCIWPFTWSLYWLPSLIRNGLNAVFQAVVLVILSRLMELWI